MPIDILTIGDVSIDQYMKVEEACLQCDINEHDCKICFDYADKIPVQKFEEFIAGNACNTAVSFNKHGLVTGVYTELGGDFHADRFLHAFKHLGIDTTYCLKNENSPTDIHSVIVYKGERTIFSYHGKKDYNIHNWDKPKWIYYTSQGHGYQSFQHKLIEYLNQNNDVLVAFNPGSYQLKSGVEEFYPILEKTDVLFVNKEEAQQITKTQSQALLELHKKIRDLGVKLSVITDGKKGSSAYGGEELYKLGLLDANVQVVDKTGAGDAYASGFISAMFYNKDVKEAMKWGTINSAGVVTQAGAVKGAKTKEEIEKTVKGAAFIDATI